jgi:hypothetical protein
MSKLGKVLKETSSPQYTPSAGEGFVYAKDDTPNILHYVDDIGTDTPFYSPQVFSFNSGAPITSFNTFLRISGVTNPEFNGQYILTRSGVLRNYFVSTSEAPSVGHSFTIRLRLNGADVFTGVISNPDTTYTNLVDTVAFSAGDRLSLLWQISGTGVNPDPIVQVSIQLD